MTVMSYSSSNAYGARLDGDPHSAVAGPVECSVVVLLLLLLLVELGSVAARPSFGAVGLGPVRRSGPLARAPELLQISRSL